jgi:low temperature requirement protein LtrA
MAGFQRLLEPPLAMFGVAALATTIPSTFDGATSGFPLAYVAVRVVMVVLYARASRHVAEARALARTFLLAFGSAVLVWLASLAFAPAALDPDVWLRLGTAAVALLLVPFDLAPLTVLVVLAGVMLLQVGYELARHERHAHPGPV